MEKITNVIIDLATNAIVLTVESEGIFNSEAMDLVVDEYFNYLNIYCDDKEGHSYHFNSENSVITAVSDSGIHKVVIENEIIHDFDKNMKYLQLTNTATGEVFEGIYYTPELIYNAELTNVKTICSTCLDNHCMQLVMYVVFKRQLMESAIALNKYADAMQLYIELGRLLEVDTCPDCNCDVTGTSCASCSGGYCSLK